MKNSLRFLIFALCFCFVCLPCASAAGSVDQTASFYVADYANVITPETENYIINNNNVQINKVQVYDIYGRLIYNGKSNSSREIISMNVATGNYIVRLFTESGIANYKLYLSK